MKKLLFVPLLIVALLASGCQKTSKASLPPHTVARNFSLEPNPGRRIEIHVSDKLITKDECRAIIKFYQKQASGGHISVHKPDDFVDGEFTPWAVYNFDDRGVTFNDSLFE